MSGTRADTVTANVDKILKNSSFTPSKPSMFRVDDTLRSINPKAYDPKLIAIGPFHRSNPELKKMEEHKKWYLKLLLKRREESSVRRYVTTIIHLEDKARKCYAEDIQLDHDEFVQMLILDGCFIIEFLHRLEGKVCWHEDDIFNRGSTISQLLHDLMVFENQIPFLIIDSLFKMIKIEDEDNINSLIRPFLWNRIFPVELQDLPEVPSNACHLLGIVHYIQCYSFAEILSHMGSGNSGEMVNISSAVELKEAGISFRRSEDNSFFHIEFKDKAMIIPEWEVSDSAESLIQNLIAYEHYLTDSSKKYFTDYVFFMHCLVHSSEDAKLLCRSRIIRNNLWSDEMVYDVINQLGKTITISDNFSYCNIFNRVNRHCGHTRNTWMSILSSVLKSIKHVEAVRSSFKLKVPKREKAWQRASEA